MNDVEQIMKQEYYRNCILTIEKAITEHPERIFGNCEMITFQGDTEICPLKHTFIGDRYVREIFIPAGCLIVGKIHKTDHPIFLMKGKISILDEFKGESLLEAPMTICSKAGAKRAGFAVEDTVWVEVLPNPNELIAKNYSELECVERKAVE
jgi:hypothetical protein